VVLSLPSRHIPIFHEVGIELSIYAITFDAFSCPRRGMVLISEPSTFHHNVS
jgi:hypothetical protein